MDYLLEIGVEELPARLASPLLGQMQTAGEKMLRENRLDFEKVSVFSSPRRITMYVQGLVAEQSDLVEEVKGPPRKVAFDQEGNPTNAAKGFAASQQVSVSSLVVKTIDSGEYVFADKRIEGRATAEVLSEQIPLLIKGITFPRPMRWGDLDFRFIRPIRWLVSLLDHQIVNFEIAGLSPGNYTYGLRNFHTEPIKINSIEDYFAKLREASVILDQEERKEMIWRLAQEEAARAGGHLQPDDELLEEVTYLVESPTPLSGSFDHRFLKLPPEVVITPMREHQRYFSVWDDQEKLLPLFIACANGPIDREIVRPGNEKVLRARLQDAEFFFQEDIKQPLEERVEELKKVVHMEGLGSVHDKVERLVLLSRYLSQALGLTEQQRETAERAAYLSKADLVTSMVFEFAELQGIMGGYYAMAGGENKDVCRAIRDHYKPRSAGDDVPAEVAGAVVAIADKIDNLVGCFAAGLEPTGSQDPFALRRQGLGICNIILHHEFCFSLEELIAEAYKNLAGMKLDLSLDETQHKLVDFFQARLRYHFLDSGYAYDAIEAALSPSVDRLFLVKKRLDAITMGRQKPEFDLLLTAYTRAAHLARQAESDQIDTNLLTEESERELYKVWTGIKKEIMPLLQEGDYRQALLRGAALAEPLDGFFDEVMVMVEDPGLRRNRLALLKDITVTLGQLGDLQKIVRKG
jgi:glycyl-tRNA synthetase beta chain